MVSRICVSLMLLAMPLMASAQPKLKELKGYLGVGGGESFDYKLVFTDSLGHIKGHSYTWLYQNAEVKAAISGYIDRGAKTIAFREDSIIYNRGFQSNATICLINSTLSYRQEEGGNVFKGPTTSSDITNVACDAGSIVFQDSEALRALFVEQKAPEPSKVAKVGNPSGKPIRIVYDTVAKAPKRPVATAELMNQVEKITQGVEKVYDWHSDTIVVHIWDGGRVDGDVISIYQNDVPVLRNYTIKKEPRQLALAFTGAKTEVFTIVAHHEGNEPPNTTDVMLVDGSIRHSILVYNSIGKKGVIKIRKVSGR